MEVRASVKHIRISPKKVRSIADLIRGLSVEAAKQQLMVIPRRPCFHLLKLLNSVIANAENNYKLKKENLYIKIIKVDGGPALKRWMPKAMGRATPIKKRSSYIAIVLDEFTETAKKKIKK
ncbi:MAG: 50S ribosomal protein L22, partial [Patescibacteria group bacterium]